MKRREKKQRRQKPLSTRRLSYLAVLMTGCVWVFFFGGVVSYTLFFLCLLLPALSLLQLVLSKRAVSLRPEPNATVVGKNQQFSYLIRLRNTGRLFTLPALRLELPQPEDPVKVRSALALLPGKGLKLSMPLSFPYRGVYTLPEPRALAGDLLGLCWMPIALPWKQDESRAALRDRQMPPPTITVCPRVLVLDTCRLFLGRLPSLPRRVIGGDDENELSSDSRLYRYGDPLNRIHWKLTAQKNEMISRQFEAEEDAELLVLLDTASPAPGSTSEAEVVDRLVECVLAVLYYYLQAGCPIRLIHSGPDGSLYEVRQNDRASFDVLFDHLSALPFEGDDSALPDLVRYAMGPSDSFAGVAAFTSGLTVDILAAMTAIHSPSHPAAIVYAAPDDKNPSFDMPPALTVLTVPPGADIAAALSIDG